jgi:hypothetical protein
VDIVNRDYHLQSDSPAIGAGSAVDVPDDSNRGF